MGDERPDRAGLEHRVRIGEHEDLAVGSRDGGRQGIGLADPPEVEDADPTVGVRLGDLDRPVV